jgi:polar amino acid transport system permease protein
VKGEQMYVSQATLPLAGVQWSQGGYRTMLVHGVEKTLEFMVISFIGAVVLGLVVALMRLSRRRLVRWPAAVYTELFKNVPLLAIIFMTYYGLAYAHVVTLSQFKAGVLSLVVFYAAYLSEIFRSAIGGIHAGQREAAEALGLGKISTFVHVIFPQALRLALPGTNTMLVDLLKSTSLLQVIGAAELMTQAHEIASQTFAAFEVYGVVALIYFALCYPLSQILLFLERRIRAGVPLTPGRRRRFRMARALLAREVTV